MEVSLAIVLISCVTILGVLGSKIGSKWVSMRALDPKITKSRENRLLEEIDDLKDEVKRWRGKAGASKQLPRVEIDSLPQDDDALKQIIDENLPMLANSLPMGIGKLLVGNKDKIFEFVKQHPEIIERFVSVKGTQGQPQTESSGIPQFDAKSAV